MLHVAKLKQPYQESSMSVLELCCHVDDFCQTFLPYGEQVLRAHGQRSRRRAGQLAMREVMTILIYFHHMRFRDFKTYYIVYVLGHVRHEFPHAVSYQRFVELMPSAVGPLCAYLPTCYGRCSGIAFVDSTALAVCHHRRIHSHRVFRALAQRGKTSLGWFYGFKLHLVINHHGELLACQLTPGNTDARRPVPTLPHQLSGHLFGDKGYLSQALTQQLLCRHRLRLVTHLKRNMANRLVLLHEKLLLRRRSSMETVCDQLKHLLHIEHMRHRSATNFAVNLLAGLIA
jgi:hypothetical protein